MSGSRYSVKRKLINLDRSLSSCIVCRRVCKGERSLKSHITQMHTGEKDNSNRGGNRGRPNDIPAWNKGLSKETSKIIQEQSERTKEKYINGELINGFAGKTHTEEYKEEISKRMSEHNPGGRCKWFEIDGKKVQGTWELNFAKYCNQLGIAWERCKPWKYIIKGKVKRYTPDFYIPSKDLYVEIKGHWWGNDRQKMNCVIDQHPDKRIMIIEHEQYKLLMDGELVW